MRRYSRVLKPILLTLVVALCLPSIAAKKAAYGIASFTKYVQIPGATPVGAETCTTCHAEVATECQRTAGGCGASDIGIS
jgi:hypothetical protein